MINDVSSLLEFFQSFDQVKKCDYHQSFDAITILAPDVDYQLCLDWQYQAHQFVKKNRKISILFFCSHPFVFTHGRGLQKKSGKTIEGLLEFSKESLPREVPFFEINRGGGLTYHYPGQLICYPIVNLNNSFWSLSKLTWGLLNAAREFSCDLTADDSFQVIKDPLGLWYKDKKVASLGIGVERFCSLHGIAFNLQYDSEVFKVLNQMNPCGLQGSVYQNMESLFNQHYDWGHCIDRFQDLIFHQLYQK